MFVYLPLNSLSVNLSICLSVCLTVCLSVCQYVYLFVYLPSVCLPVNMSVCLCICVFICFSNCQSVCPVSVSRSFLVHVYILISMRLLKRWSRRHKFIQYSLSHPFSYLSSFFSLLVSFSFSIPGDYSLNCFLHVCLACSARTA